KIHFCSKQEQGGLRGYVDMGVVMLDVVVFRARLGNEIDRVFHAGTAALLDAYANAVCALARRDNLTNTRCRGVRDRNYLETAHYFLHSQRGQDSRKGSFSKDGRERGALQAPSIPPERHLRFLGHPI